MIELTGTLQLQLKLKKDQKGNDYYHGWLRIKDGTILTFFFFNPSYDLSLKLTELKTNQELTLQGYWSKRNSKVFLASNFYLKVREEFTLGNFESEWLGFNFI